MLLPRTMSLLILLAFPAASLAYTFNFTSTATQCGSLSFDIQDVGSPPSPPFDLLLIPRGDFKPTDRMPIINVHFSTTSFTYDKLPFRSDTRFVAMLSDANGVGTGGTLDNITVVQSEDIGCFPSIPYQQDFTIIVDDPPTTQCGTSRMRFVSNNDPIQAPVSLFAVIPGGDSFEVPLPPNPLNGAFPVNTTVREGYSVLYVASDKRKIGNGGSTQTYDIAAGSKTCTFPTPKLLPPHTTSVGSSEPPKSNILLVVGPAIGGFVGGLILLFLIYLLWRRRRARQQAEIEVQEKDMEILSPRYDHRSSNSRPDNTWVVVDQEDYSIDALRVLLDSDMRTLSGRSQRSHSVVSRGVASSGLGVYYSEGNARRGQRRMSESSLATEDLESALGARSRHGRALSYTSASRSTRTAQSGKTNPLPSPRPVNYIVHDDAGAAPVPADSETPETVELPPTYASVRGGRSATGAERI